MLDDALDDGERVDLVRDWEIERQRARIFCAPPTDWSVENLLAIPERQRRVVHREEAPSD